MTDQPLRYLGLEERFGVELWPADLRGSGVCDVARTRWLGLAECLKGEAGPVCFVDTRDAVFQANPLERITDRLVIGSEGKPHEVNDWALGWVRVLAPDWVEKLSGLPVLCAGAIGGPAPLLREFALAMYHRLPKLSCTCTSGQAHMGDQALVNVLLRDGWPCEVTTDWAFHCLSLVDGGPWVEAELRDGKVYRPDGKVFPIVHQWDRAPELDHFANLETWKVAA